MRCLVAIIIILFNVYAELKRPDKREIIEMIYYPTFLGTTLLTI